MPATLEKVPPVSSPAKYDPVRAAVPWAKLLGLEQRARAQAVEAGATFNQVGHVVEHGTVGIVDRVVGEPRIQTISRVS